jgi:hypothetical protein
LKGKNIMFKKIFSISLLVLVIGVLIFGAVNRTQAKSGNESTGQGGYGHGSSVESDASDLLGADYGQANGGQSRRAGQGGNANAQSEGTYLASPGSGDLSAAEAEALVYMREEEKLAHDVYVALYTEWGLPIFQNISQSEQTHTESVKTLLERYGVTDPASETAGVFNNPDLQTLYNELVARGSHSLDEALQVGVDIEELDIRDLQERLSQVDNTDIQQVFNNLLQGSNNHLDAFTRTLSNQTGSSHSAQNLGSGGNPNGSGSPVGNGGRGAGQGGGYRGGQP